MKTSMQDASEKRRELIGGMLVSQGLQFWCSFPTGCTTPARRWRHPSWFNCFRKFREIIELIFFILFFGVGHTVRKFDEHEMQEIPYIIWKYTLRQLHYHDFTLVSSGAQVSRPHAHYSRKKTSPSWLASSKEGDDKMALNFELTN